MPGVGAPSVAAVSVECPFCDHGNPAGARFCNKCGSPVDLKECPKCDAINDRESTFCYKCRAPLAALTSGKRDAEPVALAASANFAAKDDDRGSVTIATRSATPEPAIAGFVVTQRLTAPEQAFIEGPSSAAVATTGSPVRPVARAPELDRSDPHEPPEETASRHRTAPLDLPILQGRLMHFINDAPISATYGVSSFALVLANSHTRSRFRWRPSTLTVGLLLVLFAMTAIAVFAHYRPGVIDRAIASARSALAVSIAPPKPDALVASSASSGPGAHAAKEPGTRPISIAIGSASVLPPTEEPAIAGDTSARTSGAKKARMASAHSLPPTSGGVSARGPFATSASDPADGRDRSTVRPVLCTTAVAAIGLCTAATQVSDR